MAVVNETSETEHATLLETYDINKCVNWIKANNFSKVCLQFPDSLLCDSVDIALILEKLTGQKVYILGDSSYGSCCVDEVAAQHVNADALIHYGHSCLSPTMGKLPVLYIFNKATILLDNLKTALEAERITDTVLVLYDVDFHYLRDDLDKCLAEISGIEPILSDLPVSSGQTTCSSWCSKNVNKCARHTSLRLGRTFCLPNKDQFSVIYLSSSQDSRSMNNFRQLYKDHTFYSYITSSESPSLTQVPPTNALKRCSYLVELIRNAECIGIVVATLGIQGYMLAVEHVKHLCRRASKKSYIFSVGKPSPVKLANFPEIDIFVMISCAEADFGDTSGYLVPLVTLFEVDLALNEARLWDSPYCRDFNDILPGGPEHVEVPNSERDDSANVSLVTAKKHGLEIHATECQELSEKSSITELVPSKSEAKSWKGLDQNLGDKEPCLVTQGRSGIALSYSNEPDSTKKEI